MNDTLNAVIAFVGFLMLFSMLVTSVQNGLKNLFKLKAGVWERFFINLYERELLQAPETKEKSDTQNSKPNTTTSFQGSNTVPATPFWTRVKTGEFVGGFDKRLTRLRDILVEADQLLESVKATLNTIITAEIKSSEDRKQIMQDAGKIVDSLRKLSGLNLKSLLSIYSQFVKIDIGTFHEQLKKFETMFQKSRSDITKLEDSKINQFKKNCEKLLKTINKYDIYLSDYAINIEKKADAWLEQDNQEYKRNMLKWTLIIGTVFVLAFNADSFKIFRYLMHDTKAQSALIQKATETALVTQHTNAENLNKARKAIDNAEAQSAKDTILSLLKRMQKDFKALGAENKVKYSTNLKDEIDKIDPSKNDALEKINSKYGDVVTLYAELQKESVDYQLRGLTATDLPLGWVDDWNSFWAVNNPAASLLFIIRKIGGLSLTCFLITFGAPFWKDAMNSLVGIKKTVLNRQ